MQTAAPHLELRVLDLDHRRASFGVGPVLEAVAVIVGLDVVDAPDTLTARIAIDDRPLRDILKNLYYPDSPYEFSVLPADILGQVYEQFLGKVIRLVPHGQAKRAVVEEKPEVRKAGGVFYTPTFIVSAIVRETLGRCWRRQSCQLCGKMVVKARQSAFASLPASASELKTA